MQRVLAILLLLFPRYARYVEAVSGAERQNCNLSQSFEMESKQSVAVAYVHMEMQWHCFSLHFATKCPPLRKQGLYSTIIKCDAEFFHYNYLVHVLLCLTFSGWLDRQPVCTKHVTAVSDHVI